MECFNGKNGYEKNCTDRLPGLWLSLINFFLVWHGYASMNIVMTPRSMVVTYEMVIHIAF